MRRDTQICTHASDRDDWRLSIKSLIAGWENIRLSCLNLEVTHRITLYGQESDHV